MKIDVPPGLNFRNDSISRTVHGNHAFVHRNQAFVTNCSPQLVGWAPNEFSSRSHSACAPMSRSSTLPTEARRLGRAAVGFGRSIEKGKYSLRSPRYAVHSLNTFQTSTDTRRQRITWPTKWRLRQVKTSLRTVNAHRSNMHCLIMQCMHDWMWLPERKRTEYVPKLRNGGSK
jgi:hypothetical protein